MASHIQDNFKLEMALPDFERQLFDSIADMVLFSQEEMNLPEVYECNVRDTGKRYRYNVNNIVDPTLGKWRLVEGGTAEEVYFTTTSPVTNKIGEFDLAEEITEADKITLNEAINRILHLNVDPEIVFSVTPYPISPIREVGESFSNVIVKLSVMNKNTANITNIKFTKNGNEIFNELYVDGTNEYSYTDTSTITSDTEYIATVTYNFGKGDKTMEKSFKYTFVRNVFCGTTTEDTFDLTSDNIRSLNSIKEAKKGKEVTVHVLTGTKEIIFAYPSSLGDLSECIYKELMNSEVSNTFTKDTVFVTDASNNNPIPYNVYHYRPLVAFGSDVTYIFTI